MAIIYFIYCDYFIDNFHRKTKTEILIGLFEFVFMYDYDVVYLQQKRNLKK